ncbi:ornithine--oxo-acid transaminase [Amycolatopsis sp. NPDC051106]|uniref:ornithine--oxo-acid transaminase n=1 Tax=unclassified Amycolatopsis TaxID=2618356 RepID=UPI003449FF91
MSATTEEISRVEAGTARNYHPLPVVLTEGRGAWVTDVEGRRYLDLLAGYSALNFGHGDKELLSVAHEQLDRLTLTSRAFHHDRLGTFGEELAALAGMEMVLPMNTGAEAVETAIKVARKWGYTVKGVPAGRARIIVAGGNFHGRTTTIVSFSDDPVATADFGPFTPGFDIVPFGDAGALRAAITEDTVAVLIEPVQGEAGVLLPPAGYLAAVRETCTANDVLMIADEIQSGLGRTGRTFACEHFGVVPDVYLLGKALGGGLVPLSAVVSRRDVLGVLRPGQHGSTFGGNPLACAIGTAVVRKLATGDPQRRAAELGAVFAGLLAGLPNVREVRTLGLWAGVDVLGRSGREVCEGLLRRGVLAKDAHGSTIRLAPPLVIDEEDLRHAVAQLAEELGS